MTGFNDRTPEGMNVSATRNFAPESQGDITQRSKRRCKDTFRLRPEDGIIALMDLDFQWSHAQVSSVTQQWGAGVDIRDIAKSVRGKEMRHVVETATLIMDLDMKGEIKPRKGGVFGSMGR
jgi:hypothetical protein